jgi:hypothetical protein
MHEAVQGLRTNGALDKVSARALHIDLVLGNRRLNKWAGAFVRCPAVAGLELNRDVAFAHHGEQFLPSRSHYSQSTMCAAPLAKERVWSETILLAAARHSHDEAKSSGRLLYATWGTETALH